MEDSFSDLAELEGNLSIYLTILVGTWTMGAMMEEMVFRGYLINRLQDLFLKGERRAAIPVIFSALLFGFAHAVFTPIFVILTFLQGVLLGSLYIYCRKNLWFSIIAHGTGITARIPLALFGMY